MPALAAYVLIYSLLSNLAKRDRQNAKLQCKIKSFGNLF